MKISLAGRVLSAVVAALTVISIIVGAYNWHTGRQTLSEDLNNRVDFLTKIASDALVRPMWDFYTRQIEEVLTSIQNDKDFHAAVVIDARGTVIASAGAELTDQSDVVRTKMPIIYRDGDRQEELGTVEVALSRGSLNAAMNQLLITTVTSLLLQLVAATIATIFSLRLIVRPLRAMTGTMLRLSEGDVAVEIPALERQDQIGDMARAVQVFKDNALKMARLQEEQKASEKRAAEERRQAMFDLAGEFERSIKSVVDTVSKTSSTMRGSAENVASAAGQARTQSAAVLSASEQASANIRNVAAAAEELSASISQIGRDVAQSAEISSRAVEEATRTNEVVESLSSTADKIGEVIELISGIAAQTNLLALNATIEAARAGEAGKGFAVVASEVKNLANQTGKATEEIASQISAIQGATQEAVHAIRGIAGTIREINQIAAAIASAVDEQGAVTKEIARSVTQASVGADEVAENIGGVTTAVGNTTSVADEVLGAAHELAEQAELMRTQVDHFLVTVRQA